MSDLYATLLSWAVTLSGYPAPAEAPVVVAKPHAFFVENACNHRECKVLGWYSGGRNLYIDETLDPEDSLFASSIVVHEMVHYLQAVARGDASLAGGAAFDSVPSCKQFVHWEFEAYAVQREYILRYGAYLPVGRAMLDVHCEPESGGAAETPVPPPR
jgi:hypothetical protein